MQIRFFSKALAFILLLVLADIFLISCYKSKTYKYKYTRAHLEVMEADSITMNERYLALAGDSVKAQKLFMDVHLGADIIAKANIVPAVFMGSAMAMQPNEDYYINTSRLKSIKITTLTDYNSNFPANSDITGNCAFGFRGPRYGKDIYTAAEFVEKFNAYIDENEKISDAHIPSEMFWFRINENASIPSTQQMQIKLEMEDGTVLDAESLRFRLYQ